MRIWIQQFQSLPEVVHSNPSDLVFLAILVIFCVGGMEVQPAIFYPQVESNVRFFIGIKIGVFATVLHQGDQHHRFQTQAFNGTTDLKRNVEWGFAAHAE